MKYIKTNFVYVPNTDGHIHEINGTVDISEHDDKHSHQVTVTTSQAIKLKHNHYHEVTFVTDSFDGHTHEYNGITSVGISVGDRHVHNIKNVTTINEEHRHTFNLVTSLDNIESK